MSWQCPRMDNPLQFGLDTVVFYPCCSKLLHRVVVHCQTAVTVISRSRCTKLCSCLQKYFGCFLMKNLEVGATPYFGGNRLSSKVAEDILLFWMGGLESFNSPWIPFVVALPPRTVQCLSCKASKMCRHHAKWFAITLTDKDITVPDKTSQSWRHGDDVPGDSISAQWLPYFMTWEFGELLSLLSQGSNSWLGVC